MGLVAVTEETIRLYTVLIGNPQGVGITTEIYACIWEWYWFGNIECESVEWIELARCGSQWRDFMIIIVVKFLISCSPKSVHPLMSPILLSVHRNSELWSQPMKALVSHCCYVTVCLRVKAVTEMCPISTVIQ